jgi:hypothetical protein
MAENKTKPTTASVEDFINSLPEEQKRKDSLVVLKMMKKASGEKPVMWGDAMIGFGQVRLKSPSSGREVDWFRIGFSPRKANLSLYLNGGMKMYEAKLKKLGKNKTGGGCLYINKLADVDIKVLEEIIETSLKTPFFGK